MPAVLAVGRQGIVRRLLRIHVRGGRGPVDARDGRGQLPVHLRPAALQRDQAEPRSGRAGRGLVRRAVAGEQGLLRRHGGHEAGAEECAGEFIPVSPFSRLCSVL